MAWKRAAKPWLHFQGNLDRAVTPNQKAKKAGTDEIVAPAFLFFDYICIQKRKYMERKNPFGNNPFPGRGILPGMSALSGAGNMNSGVAFGENRPYKDEKEDEEMTDEMIRDFIDGIVIRKEEWTTTHPNHIKCGSDDYYTTLANTISIALLPVNLPKDAPEGIMFEIAMSCTAYLEDLVSGLGVWNAFRNIYRRKYGKWLPFYDCEHEDYLLDNVNIEDVKFIVWQCFCRCGQPLDTVYSPFSPAVDEISSIVYNIIEERFEDAPECTRVRDFIRRVMKKGDYFEVRMLAEWLVVDNKLISSPNMEASIHEEAEHLANSQDSISEHIASYFVRSVKAWSEKIGPLGCSASVYLAEMGRESGYGNLAAKLDNLKCISVALFRVKEVGKNVIVLEDAGGECYDVEKNSFGKGTRFKEIKGYMTSIVKFGDLWQQNGMATGLTVDPFEKENLQTTYHENEKSHEWLNQIVERNGGKRIYYCRDMKEVSSILGVPHKGEEALDEDIDNFVLMLSEDEGMVVLQNYAQVFKDKGNPFYNKKEAKEDSLGLIAKGLVPEDVARIIVEKGLLPEAEMSASQGKRFGKAIVQDNMLFLFGFFRSKNPKVDY